MATTPVLNVRNLAQKVMFDEEFSGQISDGHWENSRPYEHWQIWCKAEVVVAPTNVGRNFYAAKDNYNLASRELLDIVGGRMLTAVNLALELGQEALQIAQRAGSLPDDMYDFMRWNKIAETRTDSSGDYAKSKVEAWKQAGITLEVVERIQTSPKYTMKQMMKDIRDLKQIMKMRIID